MKNKWVGLPSSDSKSTPFTLRPNVPTIWWAPADLAVRYSDPVTDRGRTQSFPFRQNRVQVIEFDFDEFGGERLASSCRIADLLPPVDLGAIRSGLRISLIFMFQAW